jgi:hypothetical protein
VCPPVKIVADSGYLEIFLNERLIRFTDHHGSPLSLQRDITLHAGQQSSGQIHTVRQSRFLTQVKKHRRKKRPALPEGVPHSPD